MQNEMNRLIKYLIAVFSFMCISYMSDAQEFAISSNILQYANMLTLNAEASVSVSRHISFDAGVLYNPFRFKAGHDRHDFNNRQRAFYGGVRYWPWHVYSGWWFSGHAKYQEYNNGGLRRLETREGDRYGAGVSFGYTYMLASFLNLEMGAGVWGGIDNYRIYSCPVCGETIGSGRKAFILPDSLTLALSFIF